MCAKCFMGRASRGKWHTYQLCVLLLASLQIMYMRINGQLQIWFDPEKILTKGFSVVYSSIRCT